MSGQVGEHLGGGDRLGLQDKVGRVDRRAGARHVGRCQLLPADRDQAAEAAFLVDERFQFQCCSRNAKDQPRHLVNAIGVGRLRGFVEEGQHHGMGALAAA